MYQETASNWWFNWIKSGSPSYWLPRNGDTAPQNACFSCVQEDEPWGCTERNRKDGWFNEIWILYDYILGGSSHLVSKWVITPVISGLTPLIHTYPIYNQGCNPLTIRGMNHQVVVLQYGNPGMWSPTRVCTRPCSLRMAIETPQFPKHMQACRASLSIYYICIIYIYI